MEPVLLHYLSHIKALLGIFPATYEVLNVLYLTFFWLFFSLMWLIYFCRHGTKNDHKYKVKDLFIQLHISWWSNVSNKSCSSCCLDCIRFSFSCECTFQTQFAQWFDNFKIAKLLMKLSYWYQALNEILFSFSTMWIFLSFKIIYCLKVMSVFKEC